MNHEVTGLLLVLAAVVVESFAQLFLKIGASGGPGILVLPYRDHVARFHAGAPARYWVAAGLLAYVAEVVLYTLALHFLDVSVAFPLGSLCFIGVALLSRWFLGETVGSTRWLGVAFILVGAICVAL